MEKNSFEPLITGINEKTHSIQVSGWEGSLLSYGIFHILKTLPKKTILMLASSRREAERIQEDLYFFLDDTKTIILFPALDILPYYQLTPHRAILSERAQALKSLIEGTARIVVTWGTALTSFLPSPEDFLKEIISLKVGQETDRDSIIQTLTTWDYERGSLVSELGTFAVRGAVLDIFPAGATTPIRLEFSGDHLESIRTFDPETQKSLQAQEHVTLLPILHQWVYPHPSTLKDYLPEDILIMANFEELEAEVALHTEQVTQAEAQATGPEAEIPLEQVFLDWKQIQERLAKLPRIELAAFSGALQGQTSVTFQFKTNEDLKTLLKKEKQAPLAPLIQKLRDSDKKIIFVVAGGTQAERLSSLLEPYQIFLTQLPHFKQKPDKQYSFVAGYLSAGFEDEEQHLWIITEEEIFGQKTRHPTPKRKAGEYFSTFQELKEGAAIVHKDYGIGLYRGLLHLNFEGTLNDFILIEYKEGDKIYLPVYRLDLVQRYVGGEEAPRLDSLRGKTWVKTRRKAEKMIREFAGELLNLYAARTTHEGLAFSPPDDLFRAFEAAFPYEETPDQERAIVEVLKDMQAPRPMERLILGDVGYGKTEVAMRAAFKAAEDGKQTVILVPTTLLAFQHYETFKARLAGYPVTLEMLSRFRTAKDKKDVLKKVREGKIDILIGTHRILQADLSFKDLGLLVIDEEHRFGVRQKEKIKNLRKTVDVLSLSATPIPRSFYMSIVGIRDVSIIETPPAERLAIQTYVTPYQEGIIRDAILKEISRGGQVFYLYNRVQNIMEVKRRLSSLVPEAKIEVAHGQMEESGLEEIMFRFYHGDFHVLLCTTIIESGIDIPTANTLIVERADQFGLAQLYQLRGRVGRGKHQAYTYLLTPALGEMTAEAQKRLKVLQKFSDLGVGYKMASYDLEIRGAGNLLGTAQSGSMAALGYELYTELLETAVAELKGKPMAQSIEPELHFPLPSFIPEDYLPDPTLRLDTYRRLASAESHDEVQDILDELSDRCGPLPPTVVTLGDLMGIKVWARQFRIKSIRYHGEKFTYAFDPSTSLDPNGLLPLVTKFPKKYKLTPDFRLIVTETLEDPKSILPSVRKLLQGLAPHVSSTPS